MDSTTLRISAVAAIVGCGVVAGLSRYSRAQPMQTDWNSFPGSGQIGTQKSFNCPSTSETTPGGVWGTDVYTDDSLLCWAAVHAGAINTAGGPVIIEYWPAAANYQGSTRNGVGTNSWTFTSGSSTSSFIFTKGLPVGEQVINFDSLGTGPVSRAAITPGVDVVPEQGTPEIVAVGAGMVAPGHNHVLMITGGPVTRFTIRFGAPIRKFSITRIGTSGGTSIPSWNLAAYDSLGNAVGTMGEQHGSPSQQQEYSIDALGIDHVTVQTDNRSGTGTWATWNSLPIAQLRIVR